MCVDKLIRILIILGAFSTCLIGTSAMSQSSLEGGMCPLKKHMLALEETFEAIIDALLLDNMQIIKPTIPLLLQTSESCKKAINAGEKINLPKNQDQFGEFIKSNDTFNKDLAALLKAAETGNKKVTKDRTHKLFDSCMACHENFRK